MGRRRIIDPAEAREQRLAALLALMPVGLSPAVEGKWQELAGRLAADPPSWTPSPRFVDLMREYCVEQARVEGYRRKLATPDHEILRETAPDGSARFKLNPFVQLLDQALKRQRELSDMLELSPSAARRKNGIFDAC